MILIVALLLIFFVDFENYFFKACFSSIYYIHKPSLGSFEVPQKFWTDLFSGFYVYRSKTNKQTHKKTDKQNIYKDVKT